MLCAGSGRTKRLALVAGQSAECSPQVAPGEESMSGSSTPYLRGKYVNKNETKLQKIFDKIIEVGFELPSNKEG